MNRVQETSTQAFDAASPRAVRRAIRAGQYRGFTNHLAPGFMQANLTIVPAAYADSFAEYCALNPQALPVLGRSEPGVPHIPDLGEDMDLRFDTGGYMVFRDGEMTGAVERVDDLWRDDLVAFATGCSFSFESILQRNGVRLRHLDEGGVSAMYVTDIDTHAVGPFSGKLVASMRALSPADAIAAAIISDRFPQFHGRPIWMGLPHLIGVQDLRESYGGHGLTELKPDEMPVFWACGATGQIAVRGARLPLCITHYKAHMLITDMPLPAGEIP